MNPLALVPVRFWLYLGGAAIVLLALWSWGRLRYQEGVNETTRTYEKAAAQQREINAKATFRAIENTAKEVETFTKVEVVRETVHVKDQTALARVWRYADQLRDELARRGATPAEATGACAAQDRRLREAEDLLGEHGQALARCGSVVVEGRDLAARLHNKVNLWKGYVEALP